MREKARTCRMGGRNISKKCAQRRRQSETCAILGISVLGQLAVDSEGEFLIYYLSLTRGGMAERLGRGLQIRSQRFNSASHLN